MEHTGFISLHRKILNWGWYSDINTCRLFIHCLLKCNYESKQWKGITIERGSFITSLENLSNESCLTIQQTKTALKKLISTNDITSKATNKYTHITVCNYETYQDVNYKNNKQNNKRNNKRTTNEQQTNNHN